MPSEVTVTPVGFPPETFATSLGDSDIRPVTVLVSVDIATSVSDVVLVTYSCLLAALK